MGNRRIFWCLGLVITLLGSVEAAVAAEVVGRLVYFQGQVAVKTGGAPDWRPASLNQDLAAGDAVQTGPASGAAILCLDESQIKLNENTLLELRQVAPSPRLKLGEVIPAAVGQAAASLYGVTRGEIWLRNKNEKFRFEMETPAVTAAIRGTEFNLRVLADQTSLITLLEGALQLTNSYGQLALQPGEEGVARPGQAPTKRVVLQPEDAVQWSLYYPGIISYRDLPLSEARAASSGPGARDPLAGAYAAYDQGRVREAREAAEAVLAREPENPSALTLLGWVRLQENAPGPALECFRKVASPGEAAVGGMALARYRLGDAAGAYELIKAARPQASRSPFLLTLEGYLALQVGRVDEARKRLEAAAAAGPEKALPRALLAQIALVQNRRDQARSEAAQAVAANPGSPAAQLTVGLVDIASFDLPAATSRMEKALQADSRFVEAYVYLAKLWLGGGYLHRAWQTIEKARALAPEEGEVLALAGFIRLAYRDYLGAMRLFHQAAAHAPGLGEPHLGLGIVHYRYRENEQGLGAILTATLLEPRISLYQSTLGKALYQNRNFAKALEVYDYASTLDKNDPTPHLYKGIALSDLNRPGEAVQELNRAMALNDNAGVFKSRLMLDRDQAVQNYNLAKSYGQLGLGDWAYSKAVTAVKKDPGNSSAYLFLANAYYLTRQRLGAGTTSLLLYRLLSPANQSTFSQYNDYTPMFEMPYGRVLAQGGVGSWDRTSIIQNHSLEVYGGTPGAAFDVAGFYNKDQGIRNINSDSRNYSAIGNVKWEPTVFNSILAGFSYLGVERGDDTNLNDYNYLNSPNFRQYARQRQGDLGFVHRFSPNATLLTYFTYNNSHSREKDTLGGRDSQSGILSYTIGPFRFWDLGAYNYDYAINSDLTRDQEFANLQAQQQLVVGDHTFLGGVDYFSGRLYYRSRERFSRFDKDFVYGDYSYIFDNLGNLLFQGPFWAPYVQDLNYLNPAVYVNSYLRPPNRSLTFYLMDYWRPFPNLLVELGVFKDQAKNARYGFGEPVSNSVWSPHLGLNWEVTPTQTLRFVLQRHLNTHYLSAPSLAPAEIASFPWQINVDEGALVREVGLAWEAQWNPKTFSVLRLNAHRIDNPVYESFFDAAGNLQARKIYWGWKRYGVSVAVNRLLTNAWGLSVGGSWKKLDPSIDYTQLAIPYSQRGSWQDYSETNVGASLYYLNPQGWQGFVRSYYLHQNLTGRADHGYWLTDIAVGKELANKRGLVSLEIDNVFNRHFYYQREFVTFDAFYPMRRILFKLALYF